MPRYYFLGNVSRSSLNSVRGEAKLTLPKANPCCRRPSVSLGPPDCCPESVLRVQQLSMWTWRTYRSWMGRISHEPYLRPVDFQEWYTVYKQMIQHCHIVAVASSPSDILGLIWHFPATLHSWNLTWTREVVWMERKSFFKSWFLGSICWISGL